MIRSCVWSLVDEIGTTAEVKPSMRHVALIYNPASGQYSARRKAEVEKALAVFREAGVTAEAMETKEAGEATIHARQAMDAGCDTVLACGGDGTVHEILQSLVGTEVALGVIPLGTANALASDLGLTGAPAKVARKLLEAEPKRISVGRIHYQDQAGNPDSRYFVVAAGIGADALVMSRMDAGLKRRLGYLLYMIECFRTWATFSFPLFEAAMPANGHGAGRVVDVSQLLAVRVRSFGGVLRSTGSRRKLEQRQPAPAGLQDAKPDALSLVYAGGSGRAAHLQRRSRALGDAQHRLPRP